MLITFSFRHFIDPSYKGSTVEFGSISERSIRSGSTILKSKNYYDEVYNNRFDYGDI
jgi:hypothetical protein